MKNKLILTQTTKLKLSLMQKIGLDLLTKNEMGLREYIDQEIEINPFMEPGLSQDKPLTEETETYPGTDYSEQEYKPLSMRNDSNDYHSFLIEGYSRGADWKTNLEFELRSSKIDEDELEIIMDMIDALDDDGYLREYEQIINKYDLDEDRFEELHGLLMVTAPPGVGARTAAESFAAQLHFRGITDSDLLDFIRDHADALKNSDVVSMLVQYGIPENKIAEYASIIHSLSITPAPEEKEIPPYIFPDITIKRENGGYSIMVSDKYDDYFTVNTGYIQMMDDKGLKKEGKVFLNSYYQRYKAIRTALSKRRDTLVRITAVLLDEQKDFFESGPKHIRPLTRSDVAEQIEMHPSTVSRAVQDKFMQTEHGLFPLEVFFTGTSGSVSTENSGDVSRIEVLEAMKELVEKEDRHSPLTDQQITEMLEEQGYRISRRAVNKYRTKLNIPPRKERRIK